MQQPYLDRAVQVACESSIAVHVLLSRDNSDVELWPLRPHAAPPEQITPLEEFTHRQLRLVGVVGLRGLNSASAFKEPLPPRVVDAIAHAFLAYTRVLLGNHFGEHMAAAEVAEIERIYMLEDPRPN
jgi:hypothetical protein